MHLSRQPGQTIKEVRECCDCPVYEISNRSENENPDQILANTIQQLSFFLDRERVDLIVVHGDRIEAMAGATVGVLRNLVVAHLEGGELSGHWDGMIRHAISKLAHLHFVANEYSARRLIQIGEHPDSVFVIGSPEIDRICTRNFPPFSETRQAYGIHYETFAIVLFHPVFGDPCSITEQVFNLVGALLETGENFIVIQPNDDPGHDVILAGYERLKGNSRFYFIPSVRVSHFFGLLSQAQFLIGNSSSGVREAPALCVPSINIGSRQQDRFQCPSIVNVPPEKKEILVAISEVRKLRPFAPVFGFGSGGSAQRFSEILRTLELCSISKVKRFRDTSGEFNCS